MKFNDIYNFFFGTLRGRLILSVAAIHAVMMALFITDLTVRQRSLILEHQLDDASGLSRTLAVSAANWIVTRDISGLQELVNLQLQYPELIFAIITDEDGQIFAHTDSSLIGQYLTDLPAEKRLAIITKTPALVDVAVPAVVGGKFVGWARIGIGQKTASEKLATITRAGILYAFGAIFIGSIIAWFMGLHITRRLYSVENTINEIEAGNHSARCDITGSDEAAILAKEFNNMLGALTDRETALEKSEKNLREAQRLARIGSWEWDMQTDTITWSEEYYSIYGFDPAQKPPGYAEHLKAYTPESAARLDDAVQKNMRTGESYEVDLELAGPEPRRWITARSETRRDAQGKIIGLRGTAQDITERKRAEQRVAFLSFALNSVCEAAFLIDENARFHFVNEEACRILGYTRAELLTMGVSEVDPGFPAERWTDHWQELRSKRSMLFEGFHRKKDGQIFPVEISANYIEYEERSYNLAMVRDITERKRAEHERQEHLKFLDCMDRVNLAMQGTDDMESMTSAVLDVVLKTFDCDRAFLLYPCDPQAAVWRVPTERNKPEYPGVLDLKLEMKMSPDVAETLHILLKSDGPVKFGPGTPHPLPADAAEQFGFKSIMSMAIYPKLGKPWQFGIHQCSRVRSWTPEEEKLFNEIGRRLKDALSMIKAYNNLKDSRSKLEEAQRLAHVGYLDRDMASGGVVLSDETCRIFGISTQEKAFTAERWHCLWLALVHPLDRQRVEDTIANALKGVSAYDIEYRIIRQDNQIRHIHCDASVVRNASGAALRMLVMIQDITERKTAAEQILKLNRIYAVLSNTNQAIVRIREKESLLNESCRIAVEYGGFQMAWVGMADLKTGKVNVAACHGFVGDYLKNIDIDLNDEMMSCGPTGKAIKTGTHTISNDIGNDEKMSPWRNNALKYGYKSSAAFPLTVFGKPIGAFNLYSKEPGFFDAEDISLLDEMTKDISFAIEYIENEEERKHSEESMKENYSTLRGIIDNADAVIFSLDRHFRYTSFNSGHASVMKALYGADIEIGRSLLDYMTVTEDRNQARNNISKALNGEMFTEESYSGEESRNRLCFRVSHCPIKTGNGEIIGVAVFVHDITERKRIEEKIKISLKEKEALLRELYHRTKNNMQVICAMLEVYAMDFSDKNIKKIFSELNNKIRSMALVHQKLYKSQNLSSIDMKEYVCELVELLMKSYKISPGKISIEYNLDDIFFSIDNAIPCGLLINELISNALKHAFPGARQGILKIGLTQKEAEYVELTVSDNGVGAPDDFDFTSDGKMGLQTIVAIGGHQLQGKIKFEAQNGVSCSITFKNKLHEAPLKL